MSKEEIELEEFNYNGRIRYRYFKKVCSKCSKKRLCYRIKTKSLYDKINYICRNCNEFKESEKEQEI